MSDSLQKDLALFNSIVEELLKEEKKNPIHDWREDTVWAKKVADEFKS